MRARSTAPDTARTHNWVPFTACLTPDMTSRPVTVMPGPGAACGELRIAFTPGSMLRICISAAIAPYRSSSGRSTACASTSRPLGSAAAALEAASLIARSAAFTCWASSAQPASLSAWLHHAWDAQQWHESKTLQRGTCSQIRWYTMSCGIIISCSPRNPCDSKIGHAYGAIKSAHDRPCGHKRSKLDLDEGSHLPTERSAAER